MTFTESCQKAEKIDVLTEQELLEQGRWEEALELAKKTRKPATVIHTTEEELRVEFEKAGFEYLTKKELFKKHGIPYPQLNRGACRPDCEIYDLVQWHGDLTNDGNISGADVLLLNQYLKDNDDYYPNRIVCGDPVNGRTFRPHFPYATRYNLYPIREFSHHKYCNQISCVDEFDRDVILDVILQINTGPGCL